MSEVRFDQPSENQDQTTSSRFYYFLLAVMVFILPVAAGAGAYILTSRDSGKVVTSSTFVADKKNFAISCKPINEIDYYRTNQAFAIDPLDSNKLYVGIEYKGIYKSIDGGESWNKSTNGITAYYNQEKVNELCYGQFGRIVIDQANPNRIITAAIGSPGTISNLFSEHAGLWLSEDGGQSWRQLISGQTNASGGTAVNINPFDRNIIYYGISNGISQDPLVSASSLFNTLGVLYASFDGGKAWQEMPTGTAPGLKANVLLINPADNNHLILGTEKLVLTNGRLDSDQSLGLLESLDQGKTWRSISDRISNGYAVKWAEQSNINPNNIYLITERTTDAIPLQGFVSNNAGQSFTSAQPMAAITYDPHDPSGKSLFGYLPTGVNPGFYRSTDSGLTWTEWGKLPTAVDHSRVVISGITVDPTSRNTLYLHGTGGYVWKSFNSGETWEVILSAADL